MGLYETLTEIRTLAAKAQGQALFKTHSSNVFNWISLLHSTVEKSIAAIEYEQHKPIEPIPSILAEFMEGVSNVAK